MVRVLPGCIVGEAPEHALATSLGWRAAGARRQRAREVMRSPRGEAGVVQHHQAAAYRLARHWKHFDSKDGIGAVVGRAGCTVCVPFILNGNLPSRSRSVWATPASRGGVGILEEAASGHQAYTLRE